MEIVSYCVSKEEEGKISSNAPRTVVQVICCICNRIGDDPYCVVVQAVCVFGSFKGIKSEDGDMAA